MPARPPIALLPHLATLIQRAMQHHGITEARSRKASAEVVGSVQETFGGAQHYIPTHALKRVVKADRAIEAAKLKRKGYTVEEIRQKFDCSLHYVYQLLSIERKRAAQSAKSGSIHHPRK